MQRALVGESQGFADRRQRHALLQLLLGHVLADAFLQFAEADTILLQAPVEVRPAESTPLPACAC